MGDFVIEERSEWKTLKGQASPVWLSIKRIIRSNMKQQKTWSRPNSTEIWIDPH